MTRVSTRRATGSLALVLVICLSAGLPARADEPTSKAAAPASAPAGNAASAPAPAAPVTWEKISDSDGIGV
jgi:hypothetical protein